MLPFHCQHLYKRLTVSARGMADGQGRGDEPTLLVRQEAWRFLKGESPLWVRSNQPSMPSVATMEKVARTIQGVPNSNSRRGGTLGNRRPYPDGQGH